MEYVTHVSNETADRRPTIVVVLFIIDVNVYGVSNVRKNPAAGMTSHRSSPGQVKWGLSIKGWRDQGVTITHG